MRPAGHGRPSTWTVSANMRSSPGRAQESRVRHQAGGGGRGEHPPAPWTLPGLVSGASSSPWTPGPFSLQNSLPGPWEGPGLLLPASAPPRAPRAPAASPFSAGVSPNARRGLWTLPAQPSPRPEPRQGPAGGQLTLLHLRGGGAWLIGPPFNSFIVTPLKGHRTRPLKAHEPVASGYLPEVQPPP